MGFKPDMKLSSGIILVRQEKGKWYYLLLRAYKNWDFPKGCVEGEETPISTAMREAMEETGISHLAFRWGEVWCETEPYSRGKIARYYIAETDQREVVLGINPELGKAEHHEARWVTYEEASNLLPPRLKPVLEWSKTILEK